MVFEFRFYDTGMSGSELRSERGEGTREQEEMHEDEDLEDGELEDEFLPGYPSLERFSKVCIAT